MSVLKKKLRRPPHLKFIRVNRTRPLFFVTICTHNRKQILNNKAIHDAFCIFCKSSPQLADVWVGRYVIMPDHIHAFVSAEGSSSLIRWVSSLKRNLIKTLKDQGCEMPIWQQGFFDHILRDAENYGEKWLYVYQNPVRAGLVEKPETWPFSGELHRIDW